MKKKILIIVLGFFIFLFAAAIILPIIFKDDIKAAIDREIEKSVNADVLFDADDFNISLFRNFPNITATMKNFGVINREPFAGNILFAVEEFSIEIHLWSVIFSDQPRIKGIYLYHPEVNINVLEDGRANWDIMIATEEQPDSLEEDGAFSFSIDHWAIKDGHIIYDDKELGFFMELEYFDHSGRGDFTQDVFDLYTKNYARETTITYDGITYLTDQEITLDVTLGISDNYSRYTFKDNVALVNQFGFTADGWFTMEEDGYGMDISFNAKENDFKSLLSLIPAMYASDFEKIEAEGFLGFVGFVRGKYSEEEMPAFNVALKVTDGMFKYPDLPTAVSNIQIDMLVDNPDGIIENTMIDIAKMHVDFGANPFDLQMKIHNLRDYAMDAKANARLNLGELTQMFPIDGIDLRGMFTLDATASGKVDMDQSIFPKTNLNMKLENGYVKSADFPIPLEKMNLMSEVRNSTGKLDDTEIDLNQFSMEMDGEPFTATVKIRDLNDYNWDATAKGGVDLEKIMKIFPMEGMELAGKIKADFTSKGKMSDLDAGRYQNIPTSGNMTVKDFVYKSKDLDYDVKISSAAGDFDPDKIRLTEFKSMIGESDVDVTGVVSNYFGFILSKEGVIKGNVTLNSNLINLNQLMGGTEEETTNTEEPLTVIAIPGNIDFVLESTIKTIRYTNLTLSNAKGKVVVRDGIANLEGLNFDMLGGSFLMIGAYDPRDLEHPKYDFNMKIQNLDIKRSFDNFNTIQALAPVAQHVNGKFSTDFKIGGELGTDMMPILGTISGSGIIKVAQAVVKNSKLISDVATITRLGDASEVTLKDVIMKAKISDGKLSVEPFDFSFGKYAANIGGSTGLDGSLDYNMNFDIPAGQLGTQVNNFLSTYNLGGSGAGSSNLKLNLLLGGTYDNPKPVLMSPDARDQVQSAAKDAATDAVTQALQGQGINVPKLGRTDSTTVEDQIKGEVEEAKEEAKEKAEEKVEEAKEELKKEAEDKIKDLLKRRGGNN